VWGVGCGVWGFTDFQVVNYLIFREKVKVLSNKVFRFIQQTLIIRQFKNQTHDFLRVDRERPIGYSVISDQ